MTILYAWFRPTTGKGRAIPPPMLGQTAGAPRGTLVFVIVGLLVLVVVLGVLTILAARPAAAHASLSASDPPAAATLDTPPTQVALTFSEPVEQQFARVAVTGPDGQRVDDGDPSVDGAQVHVSLEPLRRTGTYRVSYHVVSADSHPIEGDYTFALTAVQAAPSPAASQPVAGVPSPASSELDTAPAAAAQSERGTRPTWLLPAAAALLALGGAYLLIRRLGGR